MSGGSGVLGDQFRAVAALGRVLRVSVLKLRDQPHDLRHGDDSHADTEEGGVFRTGTTGLGVIYLNAVFRFFSHVTTLIPHGL